MEIKQFRPYMFTDSADMVTSPPFDSITTEQEASLKIYPHNITHLTLPTETPEGILEASGTLSDWVNKGILKRSEKETILIVLQEFRIAGEKMQRIGMISLVKVYPESDAISPHERTFPGPVMERANIMGRLKAQLEPIFLTVSSVSLEKILRRAISTERPAMVFDEPVGVRNSIYCVSNELNISRIKECLATEKAIVADGHHRLKAGISLAGNIKAEEEFWSYEMAYITSIHERGLLISGVHRIVSSSVNAEKIVNNLGNYFVITEHQNLDRLNNITIYNGKFIELVPTERSLSLLKELEPNAYISASLIVNELLLKRLASMDEREIEQEISYTHDISLAMKRVDDKVASLSILMPEWNKEEFIDLARKKKMLPQKSTYFYPKIPSGIAINIMER
ncbi:MAG: DUF1015 family protein [Thermoplasmataceae archaeon]